MPRYATLQRERVQRSPHRETPRRRTARRATNTRRSAGRHGAQRADARRKHDDEPRGCEASPRWGARSTAYAVQELTGDTLYEKWRGRRQERPVTDAQRTTRQGTQEHSTTAAEDATRRRARREHGDEAIARDCCCAPLKAPAILRQPSRDDPLSTPTPNERLPGRPHDTPPAATTAGPRRNRCDVHGPGRLEQTRYGRAHR